MKNYWLISGGILVGLGLNEKDSKTQSALQVIGGVSLILVAIYGFKK